MLQTSRWCLGVGLCLGRAGVVCGMHLRRQLKDEFARRVARNPRYSLRAFARTIHVHPSTMHRVLSGRIGMSRPVIHRVARLLELAAPEIADACLREDAKRIAASVCVSGTLHDARRIAVKTGVALDDVQRALSLLLMERRLSMRAGQWIVIEPPCSPRSDSGA